MVEPELRQNVFAGAAVGSRYVAFVDILGFGRQVEDNFESTLEIYTQILGSTDLIHQMREGVSVQVVSDTFIITSENLEFMVGVIQALHMQTLFHDCLVRGGIGFGKHIGASDGNNNYVVSQALVQAVRLEKSIRVPCFAVHESIPIPSHWWMSDVNPFQRGVLFFEGVRLINPFNVVWGQSAMTRVAQMLDRHPEHSDKYGWFLRLYDAVISNKPLIPS